MAKKYLNPKTWYLVGAGAVAGAAALAAGAARRLLRRRKAEAEATDFRPAAAEARPAVRVAQSETARPAAEASQPVAKAAKSPAAEKKPAAAKKKDDLTEIKGIGPTFARRLADAGITTFADLAKASPDHLREVTQATAVANPEEWVAQAREM